MSWKALDPVAAPLRLAIQSRAASRADTDSSGSDFGSTFALGSADQRHGIGRNQLRDVEGMCTARSRSISSAESRRASCVSAYRANAARIVSVVMSLSPVPDRSQVSRSMIKVAIASKSWWRP